MTTLAEIESAADRLPPKEQELLLSHLQARLRTSPTSSLELPASAVERVIWPDYEARLKVIYGGEPMPSMVIAERESATF